MKLLITLLGFINGAYMFADGLFVLLKGKYIGPEKPGPWAHLFYKMNINVFKLGPLFIVFGLAWLSWILALWTNQSWALLFGLIISVLSLWYLPIGTLFSVIILIVLLTAKSKLEL